MDQRRLAREIDKLKERILALGAEVEQSVRMAMTALARRDVAQARTVVAHDAAIDQLEVDLEEDCLKLLALYQPVAIDLRFIVAVLKINSDLERIGDLAVNIAERAERLAQEPETAAPFDLPGMMEKAQANLRASLDALVNLDAHGAFRVIAADEEVDAINRQMYQRVAAELRRGPERVEPLIDLLGVSRLLERISDHATNIAEDVIYLTGGEIIRHRHDAWGRAHEEG